ncbi:hypothetical protein KUTeg_015133 [Tegillarca granosa]|uniref:Transposase Helix-turn-helix domain-containing protein n=1 Tax=Tegillarca granosa TaxID=220873 RepID=A0ABQ9EPX2_TEGGR|nr:hypothetical protein KUTeg_015133 [Tegillarca granosa]
MVKHCSHGTCKSDSRYPGKLYGAISTPFAKPRTDIGKCLRWISLCRRPHSQLNKEKITKHTNFITLEGPTLEYPDPCDALTGELKQSRRQIQYQTTRSISSVCSKSDPWKYYIYEENRPEDSLEMTDEIVLSSLDMLSHVSRIRQLEQKNEELRKDNIKLKIEMDGWIKNSTKSNSVKACQTNTNFNFNTLNTTQSPIRNLFEFYTGLTYARFLMLLNFLFPSENGNHNPVVYDSKRKEIHQDKFPLSEQVFLYLCRLRNGLGIKDLAFRFNIKVQTASRVINSMQSVYMQVYEAKT